MAGYWPISHHLDLTLHLANNLHWCILFIDRSKVWQVVSLQCLPVPGVHVVGGKGAQKTARKKREWKKAGVTVTAPVCAFLRNCAPFLTIWTPATKRSKTASGAAGCGWQINCASSWASSASEGSRSRAPSLPWYQIELKMADSNMFSVDFGQRALPLGVNMLQLFSWFEHILLIFWVTCKLATSNFTCLVVGKHFILSFCRIDMSLR